MGVVRSKFLRFCRSWKKRNKPSEEIDCNCLNINSSYNVETGKILCKFSQPALNENKTIFSGLYENNIDVAVTKIKVEFADIKKTKRELKKIAKKLNHATLPAKAKRLISVNQKLHAASENVVKYYCYEIDQSASQPCFYLAVELCEYNLTDYVQKKVTSQTLPTRDVISQMVKGVDYLHENKILHRNLKPSKVLIKIHQNKIVVKISGFGVSKCIPENVSSISQSGEYGEPGYIAPEIYQAQQQLAPGTSLEKCYKTGSDIFPLGAVVFYVASDGHHVFSSQLDIQNKTPDYTNFNGDFTLKVLIRDNMLAYKCESRPAAKEVLRHPAIWSSSEILDFFHESSNLLKDIMKLQKCPIESNSSNVMRGISWKNHLSLPVETYLFPSNRRRNKSGSHRSTYDETSVLSLMRAMRNLKEHFGELPVSVQSEFGSLPDNYLQYWMSRFPEILIHAYDKLKVHSSGSSMKRFYK